MQPLFVKTPNLSWEFWVKVGLFPLERRVTPYPGPTGIFTQAKRVAFALSLLALADGPIRATDALQTAFAVGLDRG